MQKRSLFFSGAGAGAALFLTVAMASAQTTMSSPGMTPSTTGSSSVSDTSSSMSQNLVLGSKVMNCQVKNQQNENLGTISNLVVNAETGHIRYAVVSTGGKKVTVPWSALNFAQTTAGGTPQCTLNTTKQKLASAPKFDANDLASLSNRTIEEPIYTYYELIYFPDVLSNEEQSARRQGGSSSTTGTTGSMTTPTPAYGSSPGATMESSPMASPTVSPR